MTPRTFLTKKSAKTFETILETATRLFRTKGYPGTTMRDLARESGLGLGALYYYFQSKEELVMRFYENSSTQTIAAFRARTDPPNNLPDALTELIHLKLEHFLPYRDLLRVVMKVAVDPDSPLCPLHPASASILKENIQLFQELVEQTNTAKGQEALEMARGLWMGQMGILTYWLHDRSPNYEATYRAIQILASAVRLSTIMGRIPGFGTLRRQMLAIISNLFAEAETEEATELEKPEESEP